MKDSSEIKKRILNDIKEFAPILLILIIYEAVTTLLFGNGCPMVLITGFPCPGCGITRATVSLLLFRFRDSFAYNPTAGLWILAILLYLLDRYFFHKSSRKVQYFVVGVIAVITLVVYVYRMIFLFPGEPPLVYSQKNLIYIIVHLINVLV